MIVEFQDFVDLQTKLILMPYVEEQGIGAIVSQAPGNDDWEGMVVKRLEGCHSSFEKDGFADILSKIRSTSNPISLELGANYEDSEDDTLAVTDSAPVAEDESKTDDDSLIKPHELTSIDNTVVEEKPEDPCPVTPDRSKSLLDAVSFEDEKKEESELIISPGLDKDSNKSKATARSGESIKSPWGDLSSWTERMREGSKQLAEAASNASMSLRSPPAKRSSNETNEPVQLFIQSRAGTFLPLHQAEKELSNSSLLVIRQSPSDAAPIGSTFQWYKACGSEWKSIVGATNAAFQPSATEIGWRLHCVVTLQIEESEREIICESDTVVRATDSLFNGMRQALGQGAQFRGLQGLEHAAGRTFRLCVNIGTRKGRPVSSVEVFQISGTTAEPIHEAPLIGVSATTSSANPKHIELVLAEPDGLLEALCNDSRLKLQATNRLARESILLALGIANFAGRPSQLSVDSVLFADEEPITFDPNMKTPPRAPREAVSKSPTVPIPRLGDDSESEVGERFKLVPSVTRVSEPPADEDIVEDKIFPGTGILQERIKALEEKLAKKDVVVGTLQRQLAASAAEVSSANKRAEEMEEKLASECQKVKDVTEAMRLAEDRAVFYDKTISELKTQHLEEVRRMEKLSDEQVDQTTELEKTIRSLQNEKAVLSAAVDAREIKLSKLGELQAKLDETSKQVEDLPKVRAELESEQQKSLSLKEKVKEMNESKTLVEAKLEESEATIAKLQKRVEREASKVTSHQQELEAQQMKIQKLKAERNSFKQKGDSLAKEIGRVCRKGRTIRDVEQIIMDDASRRQEVELLREQKKTALEELEQCRQAYEQTKAAQQLAGMDHDVSKVIERNVELERLLAELTEYVSAKEMQLETMKQVNDALQVEIHNLAQAAMKDNDI